MSRIKMAMAINVAPSGLPTLRRRVGSSLLLLLVSAEISKRSRREEEVVDEPWPMGRIESEEL